MDLNSSAFVFAQCSFLLKMDGDQFIQWLQGFESPFFPEALFFPSQVGL